ncbi:MAG: hypothetical protein QG577_2263 [Thermodesulfobacteriota bacterium]|nr:hypothetical protein [Thermodesulfobacteriota bacterium]
MRRKEKDVEEMIAEEKRLRDIFMKEMWARARLLKQEVKRSSRLSINKGDKGV